MRRRTFLALGGGIMSTLAGCTGADSTTEQTTEGNSNPTSASDEPTTTIETATEATTEPTSRTTAESKGETTTQSTTDATESTTTTGSAYTVRIVFDGEWQGSITTDGSSRSIDGTGTSEYTISGDPTIVAVNAQKESDGNGELTVRILRDGEVVGEQSTTASYGVAQATSQGGSEISSGSGSTTTSEATFAFKIIYDGQWQGSITTGSATRSVDGTGTRKISIDGAPDIVSGNAQKQDDSSQKLTVQILKNGEVVKKASTTAEYGMAQVSYSSY